MSNGEFKLEEDNVKNGKGKKALMVLVVALIIAAAGGFWWFKYSSTYVETENAKVTADMADISSRIAGQIEEIKIKEGDTVEKGQIIATLNSDQYKLALKQAEAGLEAARANQLQLPMNLESAQAGVDRAEEGVLLAKAQLESARVALEDARRLMEENEKLYEAGAVSKETWLQSKSKYEMALSALKVQEANVKSAEAAMRDAEAKLKAIQTASASAMEAQFKQARAAYEIARFNCDNTVIKAPCSGTVLKVNFVPGENISAGQTIAVIADLDKTWITANVEEKKIGRIKPGQDVEVRIDAYPGRVFKGKVAEVGGAARSVFSIMPVENTSGNFTKVAQLLPVKIEVNKQGYVLKPGMSAVVRIKTSR